MESIDRALARQRTARSNAEAFEPPAINSVNDIKRVLAQLDPSVKLNQKMGDVEIATDIVGSDGRKNTRFEVRTSTSAKSHRQILLEGFQVVKQREETAERLAREETINTIEVNGKPMAPPAVVNTEGRHAMDAIIERLLGAYRSGCFICWDLSDGFTYRYEIFQHRLTKVQRNAGNTDTAVGGV